MPQCNRSKPANVPQVRQFLEYRFAGAKLLPFRTPIQQGGGPAWPNTGQPHQRSEVRSVRVQRSLHRGRRRHVAAGGHPHAVVPEDRTVRYLDSEKNKANSHHRTNTQLVSPRPTPFGFAIGFAMGRAIGGGGIFFRLGKCIRG